jgi:choloylglycine hydrolase
MTKRLIAFSITLMSLALLTGPKVAPCCMWFTLAATDGSIMVSRTMEFGVPLNYKIVVSPRNMSFQSQAPNGKNGLGWKTRYGFVGYYGAGPEGAVADGMNEVGLTVGGLWFEPNTKYQEVKTGEESKALSLLLTGPWILGNFSSVDEVRRELRNVVIFGDFVKELGVVPPLHLAVSDATGKMIVIEFEDGKLNIYDAPLGILTNAPKFPWHMTNLRQYIGMTNATPARGVLDNEKLYPTGHGSGMFGVPGDMTPPSRFVRLALVAKSVERQPDVEKNLNLAQHIVNSFDISKGLIIEKASDGKVTNSETTQFATFKDLTNRIMYQRTYENLEVTKIDLKKLDFGGSKLKYIPFSPNPQKYTNITDQAQ